jgi:hypothetical protein
MAKICLNICDYCKKPVDKDSFNHHLRLVSFPGQPIEKAIGFEICAECFKSLRIILEDTTIKHKKEPVWL